VDAANYTNFGEKLNKVACLFFEIIEISGKSQAKNCVRCFLPFTIVFFTVFRAQFLNL